MGVYTTRSLRRQDRAMTEQDAQLLLAEATCGVLCMENIDGALIGKASLDSYEFSHIISGAQN